MENYSEITAQFAQALPLPRASCYANKVDRSGFVHEMSDGTAEDYERMECILGFGNGLWYRDRTLERAGLRRGMKGVVPLFALFAGNRTGTPRFRRYCSWGSVEVEVPQAQVLAARKASDFNGVRRQFDAGGMSILAGYQASKPV